MGAIKMSIGISKKVISNKYCGHILGAYWTDHDQWPLKIFVKTYEGTALLRFRSHRPVFFCLERDLLKELSESDYDEIRPLALQTIDGRAVKAIYFKDYAQQTQAAKTLTQRGVRTFENDVRPHERFLMERFLFGAIEWLGQGERNGELQVFSEPQVKATSLNQSPRFSSLSLDIETDAADKLYSIGMSFYPDCMSSHGEHYVLMLDESNSRPKQTTCEKSGHEVFFYSSCRDLLSAFVTLFNRLDPDFLIGWHVVGFDLAFLFRQAQKHDVELTIGREQRSLEVSEIGSKVFASLAGRQILDGPALLRFFQIGFANMKLDTVASEVLGRSKDIEATGEEKILEIQRRFRDDPMSLAFYNIEDCRLTHEIYVKLNLYQKVLLRTELSGVSYDRLHYRNAHLDFSYLPRLHRKGYVAGNVLSFGEDESAERLVIVAARPGHYRNVYRLSINSLAARMLVTFKFDPFAPKVCVLPEIIEELLERSLSLSHPDRGEALKSHVESLMSSVLSPQSRYFRSDLAEKLNEQIRWFMRRCLSFFDNQGISVIYADTNEFFLCSQESEEILRQSVSNLFFYLKKLAQDELKVELSVPTYELVRYERLLMLEDKDFFPAFLALNQGETLYQGEDYSLARWCGLAGHLLEKIKHNFLYEGDIEALIKEQLDRLKQHRFDDLLFFRRKVTKELDEYTKTLPAHMQALSQSSHSARMKGRWLTYAITTKGPQLKGEIKAPLDYDHYVEKQIRPIADSFLKAYGKGFDERFAQNQLTLF